MKKTIALLITLLSLNLYADATFVWGMRQELDEYEKIAQSFKKDIETKTKGAVKIEIKKFDYELPNPLKSIEDQKVHIYQVPVGSLSFLLPDSKLDWTHAWSELFLFKDKTHVESYIASDRSKKHIARLETDKLKTLTYSYAGGFLSILSQVSQKTGSSLEELTNLKNCPSFYFGTRKKPEVFEQELLSQLPCALLQYETHELAHLTDETKKKLRLDITGHLVVSRLTFLSKESIDKIPPEYKDYFMDRLTTVLNKERESIYDIAEKSINSLKKEGLIEIVKIDPSSFKSQARELSSQTDSEINYIKSLWKK